MTGRHTAGRLTFARVVSDLSAPLRSALADDHTGVAVVEPQQTILLDATDRLTLWFDDGVPTHARHSDGRTGGAALAALATASPYRVELHERDRHAPPDEGAVAPDAPADHLAGDPDLAERTRTAAPDDRDDADGLDAVEAFLADEEAIADLQEQAREQAERRADEWGFDAVD